MEKDHGVLYLEPLYDFVKRRRNDPQKRDIGSAPFAYRLKHIEKGYDYPAECKRILSEAEVPKKRGFYLWGFYNHEDFWINVYVGISAKGKTSDLKARVLEELKDERAFIWRESYTTTEVIGFDPKYETVVKRALRKAGSTHVFWVAETQLAKRTFEAVEYDLIEAMNPTGNRMRRTPSGIVQPEAGKILNTFREMIHGERGKPTSRLKLDYHKDFWKWVGRVEPTTP